MVADAGRLGTRRHIIHALIEIDVTDARRFIRGVKAETGRSLSFTAFLLCCLARAIEAHPNVCAYKTRGMRGRRLILFNEVDIVTMIETEIDGVALPHVVRAANRKSYEVISDEIGTVRSNPGHSKQTGGLSRWGARLPWFVRDIFYRIILSNPHRFKRYAGTAIVTAVGMFTRGGGWGIGFLPMHTLGLTVGGLVQRPAFVGDTIAAREYLSVTISFDHDVVDGAPAARFVDYFRQLVEDGACLRGVV
ncbi:MAG: 2-oxo acid dehydrogenase subunit E2 [Deltaproteobacteria bacterium]|nr:2-oxo acid dehydrogenase subunit E2 [Candidatus Zymogenaceae bacterium]